ncbi:pollen-specific leucine-rich repeat extensin-like protein 2 [Lathyrus oleraceus]|uniref:pollen-specific leucine-rich repeat extensin-like protein 2 n=1 Tax=Pisum sativum TaxID=3888 RepID=UPI0021CF3224|nr:pollen-specific leucine-rich repeat extensin-like protein 2 [Pisum sativum]
MAHHSDTTSFTTVSDSHSKESGNPNREEVSVNAATSPHARRPKETVSRISTAIALDNPSKEGSRYVHNAIASMVTKILSGDRNVPGVSVPLNTIVPDDVAYRETAVVLRQNVSGLPEEGPKNDKHVSKVRGEKVSVPQEVEANPRADTVNLDEFCDNELLASVIPSIAKRVRTRRGKKTVMQRSPSKEVDETTPHKQTGTESAHKRKGYGPTKSWSKEKPPQPEPEATSPPSEKQNPPPSEQPQTPPSQQPITPPAQIPPPPFDIPTIPTSEDIIIPTQTPVDTNQTPPSSPSPNSET